ncbi:24547_t:CDS:2 [Gigaspora margarita]|uniref:24547_t:CDS:1 n=1 Tax=Gigaspora margarita TaxID=4874 RepID=A0ABN7UKR5_GIGMA|nr:24547_t:CDS:2 [Gigaspora margarita]
MDDATKSAFEVLLSGVLPVGYMSLFQPLLNANIKTYIDDIFIFWVEPLIPLFYVFNKNEVTGKYLIPIFIYIIFKFLAYILFWIILNQIVKKNDNYQFKYKTPQYFKDDVIEVLRRTPTHPIFIFWIVLIFLAILIVFIAFVNWKKENEINENNDENYIGSHIISIGFGAFAFASSILYLVIIPADDIYVKIGLNIDLFMLLRLPEMIEENPYYKKSDDKKKLCLKNRGLVSVVLFGIDTEMEDDGEE